VAPVDAAVGDALAQSDAIDALKSMGYSVAEARNAIEGAPKDMTDVGDIVKFALKNLGK
jgi:Holliday junction resolvasome RuvABC DNA-binding subunit